MIAVLTAAQATPGALKHQQPMFQASTGSAGKYIIVKITIVHSMQQLSVCNIVKISKLTVINFSS
jgi:hypothetical protein